MNRQLTMFDAKPVGVHDSDRVSGTNFVHDRNILKQQAIERYLNRAKEKEPVAHIEKYSPGRRNTKYYRLVFRISSRRLKRIHIKGGSTISELAEYRRKELQKLIDRGAELAEILAAVHTFNGNKEEKN